MPRARARSACARGSASGMVSETAIEAIRPTRTGSRRPRRSDQRPSSGLCAAPERGAHEPEDRHAERAHAHGVEAERASTVRQPNSSEGRAISQTPEMTSELRSAETISRSGWRSWRSAVPACAPRRSRARRRAARHRRTRGPAGQPRGAADERAKQSAGHGGAEGDPSNSPRRSGGASAAATPERRSTRWQRRFPAQSAACPAPTSSARPKPAQQIARTSIPTTVVARSPTASRAMRRKPRHDAAGRVRAAEDAHAGLREPELPDSSGSSGVRAAKNSVSTRTTAQTSTRRRRSATGGSLRGGLSLRRQMASAPAPRRGAQGSRSGE